MTGQTKKIAIIGMGIAGVSALREWNKEKKNDPRIEITAFGDAATYGRGEPYQKEDELLIMNQPAELATIIPEKKDDFVDWLKDTEGEKNPRHSYYPRALFGQYLHERMLLWAKESDAKTIKEKVESIQIVPNEKFRVTSENTQEDFDVVHLCIGSAPYQDDYHLNQYSNFILNPFPVKEKLSAIPKDAKVGIIGTGLTSVDILRYLDLRRSDLDLSFFSHSGRFKTARGETISYDYQYFTAENIKKEKAKGNGFIPLETYFDWFKKEVAYQGLSIDKDWFKKPFGSIEGIKNDLTQSHEIGVVQTLILGLDPFLTEMWMALTEADKTKFFEQYGDVWDKVRSSFPVESGEILLSRWEEGKIKVFSNLVDVLPKEKHFQMILDDDNYQTVDYIINAAGSVKNLSFETKRIPLLSQMLNERILQPEAFGGVQVTAAKLSAVSQKYGVLDRLKVHGPLISGIQFGNNSIDIISEGVQGSVKDLIKEL